MLRVNKIIKGKLKSKMLSSCSLQDLIKLTYRENEAIHISEYINRIHRYPKSYEYCYFTR